VARKGGWGVTGTAVTVSTEPGGTAAAGIPSKWRGRLGLAVKVRQMARHVVHRRNGEVDEYQELPDADHLEPDSVTVTFPDGSLRSNHAEDGLDGIGFEFADAGILVLRFEDSEHVLSAFAPTAWTSVRGTALGDRGRRSSTGR
jgi:hypothetical protein